jgi:hypothetical protein
MQRPLPRAKRLITLEYKTSFTAFKTDRIQNGVVRVDGVRRCQWTAATNGPIANSLDEYFGMILTGKNRRTQR